MAKFIGSNGLAYLWSKIKNALSTKLDADFIVTASNLSDNSATANYSISDVINAHNSGKNVKLSWGVTLLPAVYFSENKIIYSLTVAGAGSSPPPAVLSVSQTGTTLTWNERDFTLVAFDANGIITSNGGNINGTLSFNNDTEDGGNNYIEPITSESVNAINAGFRVNEIEFAGASDYSSKVTISDGVLNTTEEIEVPGILHRNSGERDSNYVWTTDGEYADLSDYATETYVDNSVELKADKIPEVNHGTSDTTFTLTPNIMHIWGEVSSLTLSLSTDTNSVLDEYLFTFTCPSNAATTLTLPATIDWVLDPSFEAGKTYQVSIVNGLAGYITSDMSFGETDPVFKASPAYSITSNDISNWNSANGTVTSVTVNGSNYTPDTNGLVNLGTISGGEGGTGGEYNVIEGVTFNGSSAPITNKIAAITYTAPTLSKGTTTGNGNAVTDITVSGHTVTLTKGTTFLTSYTETDPTVPSAVKAITSTDISNWNSKATDSNVVHLTGTEIITGDKTFTGVIYLEESSDNYIEDQQGYLVLNSETGVKVAGNDLEITDGGLSSYDQIEVPTIICTSTSDRASNKFFATDGTIQTVSSGSTVTFRVW